MCFTHKFLYDEKIETIAFSLVDKEGILSTKCDPPLILSNSLAQFGTSNIREIGGVHDKK